MTSNASARFASRLREGGRRSHHGCRTAIAARVAIAMVLTVAIAASAAAGGLETQGYAERISRLYLDAGIAMPTVSLPLSHGRAVGLLDDLLARPLPDGVHRRAEALRAEAAAEGRDVEVRADVVIRPELYLDVPRSPFAEQARVEDPLASLLLAYGRPLGPYIAIEAVAQREWVYRTSATNVPRPVDGNPVPAENNLVRTGYLHVPSGGFGVTFGRQRFVLGPDAANTLSVSSAIPFLDALKLTWTLGPLTMTSLTSTLENREAVPKVTTEERDSADCDGYGFGTNTILYNIHYFEFAWPRVRAGIGSQVVIARPMNYFYLGDFFPVFSWHNAGIRPNNMSLLADVTVAPARRVELFAQVGFDDISGESFGFADAAIPTIDAYIAGVRTSAPWFDASASVIGGYTHYLWGTFEDGEYLARAIYRIEADGPRPSMPLTSPHGPGALWMETKVAAATGPFSGALTYLALGTLPDVDVYSVPYASSAAIEARARSWTHDVRIDVGYRTPLGVSVHVGPGVSFAPREVRPYLEAGAEIRFASRRSITR
ncbi:MAG: hypothetical protein ACOCVO_02125 [bacterium]